MTDKFAADFTNTTDRALIHMALEEQSLNGFDREDLLALVKELAHRYDRSLLVGWD